ncbi:hypothetical protein RKD25_007408 [Streptomyces sp. SAI-124]
MPLPEGADEDDEVAGGDHLHESGDQPVAAEEAFAVTCVEAREAQIGGLARIVGGPALLRRLVGRLLPPPLPLVQVASAGRGIGEGDLEGGEPVAGRCLGQGRGGVVGPLCHGPVGGAAGLLP